MLYSVFRDLTSYYYSFYWISFQTFHNYDLFLIIKKRKTARKLTSIKGTVKLILIFTSKTNSTVYLLRKLRLFFFTFLNVFSITQIALCIFCYCLMLHLSLVVLLCSEYLFRSYFCGSIPFSVRSSLFFRALYNFS